MIREIISKITFKKVIINLMVNSIQIKDRLILIDLLIVMKKNSSTQVINLISKIYLQILTK